MGRNTKIVSISLSKVHHKIFLELKEEGYFPSVSAGVRYCINNTIIKIVSEVRQLNEYIRDNDVINVVKKLKEFGYVIYRNKQKVKKIPIISLVNDNRIEIIQ